MVARDPDLPQPRHDLPLPAHRRSDEVRSGSTGPASTSGTCPTPATSASSRTRARRRSGRWGRSSTRSSPTASPARRRPTEHATPDWAIPAAWSDPVDISPKGVAHQLYGGDLDGITEHLDHLESLGVDVVYLTPFFPARSNHRYDASSFEQIDPLLGGAPALRRLTKAAHERGMKVMGDFTTNHTGNAHEWFLKAAGPGGKNTPERDYYIWEDGTYVAWLGVPSLPKLNHLNAALRHRIFEDPRGRRPQVAGPLGRARRVARRRRQHDGPLARHRRQPRRRPPDARRHGPGGPGRAARRGALPRLHARHAR